MTDGTMRIYDLTAEQCALLDKMWAIEQWDELQTWVATLSPAQQLEVDTLTEMISLAIVDEETEPLDTFSLAKSMLRDIGVTVK
jgi:hypothetical protein